jgi:hypothetical protein
MGRLYIGMSSSMSANREQCDHGKKPSGSNNLSFRSANTRHDEIVEFLQSGPELTCWLLAKALRIGPGWGASDFLAEHAMIVAFAASLFLGARRQV